MHTVAMESTGVYWKSLFTFLIHQGFEMYLVIPEQIKNITSRKTCNDLQHKIYFLRPILLHI
ncbi:IS110 family transposase [Arachidicoccus ginsenosidivorans]|jgi:transposase|uniref:IS110 family transposase n=1 Tax=Arachidicoccus ginsenosidivorans TaxID=496057 RepID=UPI001CEF6AAE